MPRRGWNPATLPLYGFSRGLTTRSPFRADVDCALWADADASGVEKLHYGVDFFTQKRRRRKFAPSPSIAPTIKFEINSLILQVSYIVVCKFFVNSCFSLQ